MMKLKTNITNIKASKAEAEAGFTLVELALVMIVIGIITTVIFAAYKTYTVKLIEDFNEESISSSSNAASIYQLEFGTYPCPADPTLGPEDIGYGLPDCNSPNVIRVTGARDLDNADGDNRIWTNLEPNPMEVVLIGAVPVTLYMDLNGDGDVQDLRDNILALGATTQSEEKNGFKQRFGRDAWGNKLTYAVSLNLTNVDADNDGNNDFAFNPRNGVIDVTGDGGHLNKPMADIRAESSLLEPYGSAHFVIVSHGENGMGAHTEDGVEVGSVCNPGAVVPIPIANLDDPQTKTSPDEDENCDDDDAVFLSTIRKTDPNNYFDDEIKFVANIKQAFWEYTDAIYDDRGTPMDTSDDILTYQITNTNPGNVGFGTNTPSEKVEVNGDIQAYQIHSDKLCGSAGPGLAGDSSDDDCMDPQAIAGELPSMQCPTGYAIKQIKDNKVVCEDPWATTVLDSCSPLGDGTPTFIVAISSSGAVTCDTEANIRAKSP